MLYNKLFDLGLNGNVAFVISIALCIIVPYIIGSLNFGIIISKRLYHNDVRKSGSGNAGSTNMLRTYGKKAGGLTFLLDCLKTVVSIGIGPLLYIRNDSMFLAMFIAGFACMVGHSYPVFFKFKGGKGVACFAMLVTVTSICMNMWYLFVGLLVLFIIVVAATKFVSLASILCAMLYPVVLNRLNGADKSVEIFAVAAGLFVVFQHRENIARLLQGKENKLSFSKKDKSGETK